MKKTMASLAAVLLVAGSLPVLTGNVAFADTKADAQSHADAHGAMKFHLDKPDVDWNKFLNDLEQKAAHLQSELHGKALGHLKPPKPGKPDKQPPQPKPAPPAQLEQLKSLVAQFQADQKSSLAARAKLKAAAEKLIGLMQQAIQSGNANVLKQGTDGIRQILQQLKDAIAAQNDLHAQTKASLEAGKAGKLDHAIQAITQADNRLKAKIAAMQKATDALNQLSNSFSVQLSGSPSTQTSTQSSANSGVESEGNVAITVTGSN